MNTKDLLVLEYLHKEAKPLHSNQIAIATGISKKDLAKVIKELKSCGKIYSPKWKYYQKQ